MTAHRALNDGLIAEYEVLDSGASTALVLDRDRTVTMLVTAAAETRTLAAPSNAGVLATLNMKTDGGDCVVTVASAVNQTGNNTLTFADAGDVITLLACRLGTALVWRVLANDGVALSTV